MNTNHVNRDLDKTILVKSLIDFIINGRNMTIESKKLDTNEVESNTPDTLFYTQSGKYKYQCNIKFTYDKKTKITELCVYYSKDEDELPTIQEVAHFLITNAIDITSDTYEKWCESYGVSPDNQYMYMAHDILTYKISIFLKEIFLTTKED